MLSKTGLHAIRAMVILAQLPEGAYAGASSIAKNIGAPQNYLGKLLQALCRTGLVNSQKGLNGGFRLARRPEKMTLLDIAEPIEHVSRWSRCILSKHKCSGKNPCNLHDRWSEVRAAYLDFLEKTRISDLAGKNTKKRVRFSLD